jgi:hypothetical protein
MMAAKPKAKTAPVCQSCRHAVDVGTALVCHRYPPLPVVIKDEPRTMRASVNPGDRACGEYGSRA